MRSPEWWLSGFHNFHFGQMYRIFLCQAAAAPSPPSALEPQFLPRKQEGADEIRIQESNSQTHLDCGFYTIQALGWGKLTLVHHIGPRGLRPFKPGEQSAAEREALTKNSPEGQDFPGGQWSEICLQYGVLVRS